MRRVFIVITIPVLCLGLPPMPTGSWTAQVNQQQGPTMCAYIANTGADMVTVIDLATGMTAGPDIPVGSAPSAVVVSPDQRRVYVANSQSNTVSVIDTESNQVVDTIKLGKTTVRATGLALSPDGRRLFLTHSQGNTVYIANTITNAEDDEFPVSGRPYGLVWADRSGPFLYISTPQSRGVTSVDLFETRRSRQLIRTGPSPSGVVISPDWRFVYVADMDESKISVITTVSNTVGGNFEVRSGPDSLALTPDGERLLVGHLRTPEVLIVDPADGSSVATVPTGSSLLTGQPGLNRLAMAPDGLRAVIANEDDDTITVIDLKTASARGSFPVGDRPTGAVIVGRAAVCDPHPNAIDFGEVPSGQRATDFTLGITNRGTDWLNIESFMIDNPAFEAEGMPRPLAPRERATFIVRFISTTLGEHLGTLWFETNDADPERCHVRLRGVRLPAQGRP